MACTPIYVGLIVMIVDLSDLDYVVGAPLDLSDPWEQHELLEPHIVYLFQ